VDVYARMVLFAVVTLVLDSFVPAVIIVFVSVAAY
jgi:hypothetical protein